MGIVNRKARRSVAKRKKEKAHTRASFADVVIETGSVNSSWVREGDLLAVSIVGTANNAGAINVHGSNWTGGSGLGVPSASTRANG